jgi:hypothetical protein
MNIDDDVYNDICDVLLNMSLLALPVLFVYNLRSVNSMVRTHLRDRIDRYSSENLSNSSDDDSDNLDIDDDSDTMDSDDESDSDISDDTITPNDMLSDNDINHIIDQDILIDEQTKINKKNVNDEILKRGIDNVYDNSLTDLQEKIREILSDL